MKITLHGGRVLDPASGFDAIADVVVDDGLIIAVGPTAGAEHPDAELVDCTGMLVTPGLIDLHAHVMPGLGDFCVSADSVGVDQGVPTVVDGGTSGVATFDLARMAVVDHPSTRTRVLCFIDPNQLYLATKDFICHKLEIANDLRNLDEESLAASLERNADIIVGLKVRACHVGDDQVSPFLTAAQRAGGELPIMVHLGRFPHTATMTTPALLRQLRSGDIITHAFRGGGGLLDYQGGVTGEFRDAVDRGVRLDIGHSGTDFRFREARRLFDLGYLPDTISTDLNVFNIGGPVYSLTETMSKVWAMGVDLVDVVAMVTSNTATSIRRTAELGALAIGRTAEISVLRIDEGEFSLSDGFETLEVERRIAAEGCVRAGEWMPARSSVPA
ncbi:MAG: amidohydrolase/deacetylase family metallohydrolase [Ilumatobacteraceae bacterium]